MSEVTICNLALSHLGDTAQVTSIKPPDGSVQAQLCANFYWTARNALLEMASWGFATRRVALAEVSNPTVSSWIAPDGDTETSRGTWRFAYALPSGAINVLAVIPPGADSDYQMWFRPGEHDHLALHPQGYLPEPGAPLDVPQPFAVETQTDGSQIVLTNVRGAILRYTTLVEDTTKFSPLFTLALSYLLASMIAGPLIKGDVGMQAAEQMLQMFTSFKGQAEASDANQRKTRVEPAVSWIRGR
jgi:hypothetical protein